MGRGERPRPGRDLAQWLAVRGVITLDASFAVAVQKQLEQDQSSAKIVTYAFNSDLNPLLQDGKVAFTIDQQPYLQGYMAVDSLWLYNRKQGVLGAKQPIATGQSWSTRTTSAS